MATLSPIIQIVDDDPTVCESLSFFLQLAGWQVETYGDPLLFLQRGDWQRPGCIILDVRMPNLTGIEVQKRLKEMKIDTPIIFLSAHGDIEMALNCVQQGAFNFLVKPPEPEKLKDMVEKAIKLHIEKRKLKKEVEALKVQFQKLTPTEQNVARLVAKGFTNKVVSGLLDISERTVQSHRSKIFEKLELENPVELFQFLKDMESV